MTFVQACKRYFGGPGQTNQEFLGEFKQLTPQDRLDLLPELERELGEKIETSSDHLQETVVSEVLQESNEQQAQTITASEIQQENGESIATCEQQAKSEQATFNYISCQ